jgi:hypothetical protein
MTNDQLYFAIGLPIFAIVASLILNIVQVAGIRRELDAIRADIREIRSDIKLLTGKIYEMMEKP